MLHVGGNWLARLPLCVLGLPRLEWLHAGNNRLEVLPSSVDQLAVLQSLLLNDNQLRPAGHGNTWRRPTGTMSLIMKDSLIVIVTTMRHHLIMKLIVPAVQGGIHAGTMGHGLRGSRSSQAGERRGHACA